MRRFILILLVSSAPLAADCIVGAEALYWKPCNSSYFYGSIGESDVVQRELTLTPDYDWGFRIYGEVNNSCYFANLEWAYYRGTTSAENRRGDPFSAALIQGASQQTRYNKVSLKGGLAICRNISVYFGGRWFEITLRQSSRLTASVPVVVDGRQSTTNISAGGVEAGIRAYTDIWCGFGLEMRLGVIGAVGQQDHTLTELLNQSIQRKDLHSQTLCLSALEVRAALSYRYECGRCWIQGEIGYEMDYYFDALLQDLFLNEAPEVIPANFGIGGPFVGLRVGF